MPAMALTLALSPLWPLAPTVSLHLQAIALWLLVIP